MIQRLDRVLWGLALASAVSGIGLAMSMVPAPDESIWGIPSAPGALAPSGGNAGDIVRSVVSTDPFRLERRPSSVPFGTEPPITPVPERLTAQAPHVSGIVGPPWRAALAGIAGRDASVLVATGDTLAGWRVVSVERDSVVIAARDTTWRLSVRRP
jgi:hypothetical protein